MIFLIPAAGKGTRVGLPYPKCLHEYNGTEIIISNLKKIDSVAFRNKAIFQVVILIARGTLSAFLSVINKNSFFNLEVHFGQQIEAEGTASAVLQSFLALKTNCTERFCIIWGDCIGYTEETLQKLYRYKSSDVVIPGLYMRECYTKFEIDTNFNVLSCRETKGSKILPKGYTDIGLFTVNKASLLSDSLPNFIKNSDEKIENSFIEFISYCCTNKIKVKFLNCCSKDEKKGFNSFEDLNEEM
jgi:bifunctional N-acetylglucosamine-1-phosphate-uridyltransferase/glucosamine-1-phosphate-acetyltransferase GlmU-like protein